MNGLKIWDSQDTVKGFEQEKKSGLRLDEAMYQTILCNPKKLLDVGCATGNFYRTLKTFCPNIDYVGIDLAPALVAQARENHPRTKFFVTNAENLSFFKKNSFDTVVCAETLYHVENWKKTIKELFRVSSKNIVLSIHASHGKEWFDVSKKLPYRIFDAREVLKEIKKFHPVSVKGIGLPGIGEKKIKKILLLFVQKNLEIPEKKRSCFSPLYFKRHS